MNTKPDPLVLSVVTAGSAPDVSVPGLLLCPVNATACFVFAHGAGAGMTHPFMGSVANGLASRGIATLRYDFPYMHRGSRRPDSATVCAATVRAAVAAAARALPQLPLIAGGKSFGGRMTSQAQAHSPLSGVRGLVFWGFPLHPAGRPSNARAQHLAQIHVPMLFLQGVRDKLADPALLGEVVTELGSRATLLAVQEADHSFHVPARSGKTDAVILAELMDGFATWLASQIPSAG